MASSAEIFRQKTDHRGPLSKLYEDSVIESLVFPGDLADLEHFAIFGIRERSFESSTLRTTSKPAKTKRSQNIFLPMPPQLQTSYGVNYQNSELGGAGAAFIKGGGEVFGAIGDAISAPTFAKGSKALINAGSSLIDDIRAGGFSGAFDALKEIGSRIVAESDNSAVRGAFSTRNVATNPYQAVFFTSPNFRTHSFSYTLFAKNENESETIRRIIRALKKAMLPSITENTLFFEYPKVFEITFRNDDHLFEIGTSVLTQFDVNYHGEGTPSYFDNTKAPTNVQISMSFQEVNILTSEDVGGEFSEVGKRR